MTQKDPSPQIRPLHNRVLIKRLEATERQGLIYVPDTAKEAPARGIVMGVGDLVEEVAVGDEVLFGKYAGNEIRLGEGEYLILQEDDVLCVVEENA